jgi:hypothetical protein
MRRFRRRSFLTPATPAEHVGVMPQRLRVSCRPGEVEYERGARVHPLPSFPELNRKARMMALRWSQQGSR